MEKLSMLDATFLYSETPNVMNHIASLQQYQLPENITAEQFIPSLKHYLLDRIHLLPYLTRKVQMIPGGLDHAVWVQDGKFDISNHVIEVPLQTPGDFDQLQDKVAELHSKPMDRTMPLWRFYVITGLDDGNIAYYAQVHHACVDGMAGQAMTFSLTDTCQEPQHFNCPADYLKDEAPDLSDLFTASFRNLWQFQSNNVDRTLNFVKTATNLTQRAIDPGKSFGAFAQQAPKTCFNHTVTSARSYACAKLPFQDVRQMGKTAGASINDVFLAICSGALRRYLERRGELPRENLIAGCPVAVPKPGKHEQGNSVTLMNVDLFSHTSDPRVRLLRIKGSCQTAKEVTAELADSLESNVSLPGLPALTRTASILGEFTNAAEALPTPFNVLISNVPGPRETLFSNGAKMLSHYPVSIPTHGLGLNITVQSYTDGLYVGLTASSQVVPDLKQLRDDLTASYLELRQLLLPAAPTELSDRQEVADLPAAATYEPINSRVA